MTLGQTHIQPGAAYSVGPRAYEIAACGAFQLCDNSRPELKEVFGNSVETYQDADDLGEKMRYYIQHDDERADMAYHSWESMVGHSYVDRTQHILIPTLERWSKGGA